MEVRCVGVDSVVTDLVVQCSKVQRVIFIFVLHIGNANVVATVGGGMLFFRRTVVVSLCAGFVYGRVRMVVIGEM
jgi:hypothetical protein